MLLGNKDNLKHGLHLNIYGSTKTVPEGWVEIELNLRIPKHRQARDSKRTNFIHIMMGWKGSKKWKKPILTFATNTPELANQIMELGDVSNAEMFIEAIK